MTRNKSAPSDKWPTTQAWLRDTVQGWQHKTDELLAQKAAGQKISEKELANCQRALARLPHLCIRLSKQPDAPFVPAELVLLETEAQALAFDASRLSDWQQARRSLTSVWTDGKKKNAK